MHVFFDRIIPKINHRVDGPSHAAKALKRRLKSDNPKILQLALTLCEATVKNCSRPLHQALGQREFLAEVANLCNGQKGYEVYLCRVVDSAGIRLRRCDGLVCTRTSTLIVRRSKESLDLIE